MSLENPVTHCPLLLEGDILSLSHFFELHEDKLHDPTLSAWHALSGPGSPLVAMLQRGCTYAELLVAARLHRVSSQELHALLGFLNRIGGLQRKRSWRSYLQAYQTVLRHITLGIHYPPLCWRVAPSLPLLTITTLRATMPVILAVGIVAILWWIAGLSSAQASVGLLGGGLVIFIVSIVIHETTHVRVLHKHALSSHVLQLGMHIGIIHRCATPQVEMASAIAGPLAGAVACGILAAIGWWNEAFTLSITSLIIAALHLGSLLPYYGDGVSLLQALRGRKDIHEKRSVRRTH